MWSENSGAQRGSLAQLCRNFLLPVLFFFTELTLPDIILHIYYFIDFLSLSPSLENKLYRGWTLSLHRNSVGLKLGISFIE